MQFFRLINKKLVMALLSVLMMGSAMAQNAAAPAEKTVVSGNNQLATLLVVMTLVLAFVIWGLGQVLILVSRQVLDKKKSGQLLSALLIVALMGASQVASAQTPAATAEAVKVLPNYGGLSANTFYLFVVVIIMEVFAIFYLAFHINRMYALLMPKKAGEAAKASRLSEWWNNLDKKIFTRAIPVEKEADVMLDHDYDGIRELDNALPPWWKYGFYVTIVVAFVYLLNFHVLGVGKNPTQEYAAEMERAKIQKELYDSQNKDKIDENNVPMADATGINRAKEIFNSPAMCWTCHGKLGEGGAGPNLTDDYWIHKGSLNDIYQSIKHGYPDKGMQGWDKTFTPKEISYLASYIKSLRGTNPPNAQPPKGELWTEGPAAGTAPVADSTKVPAVANAKPDSVKKAEPKK